MSITTSCPAHVGACINISNPAKSTDKVKFGAFADFTNSNNNGLRLIRMERCTPAAAFNAAFPQWLKNHGGFVAVRTRNDYQQYGTALIDFFTDTRLEQIDFPAIRGYQHWRWKWTELDPDEPEPEHLKLSKYRHSANSVRIKNELNSVLKPMLRQIGTWEAVLKAGFRHLPVSGEGAGVALTKEETRSFLAVAFSHKTWLLAAHSLTVMYRTGSGFGEIRRLRRKDVDLALGRIHIVKGAKNKHRIRTVALVPSARDSAQWLIERWQKLGGRHPDEYLLPHRGCLDGNGQGLTRPMLSINWAFQAIKKAAILKHPEMKDKLNALRIYDARPSAASVLMENPRISLTTIEKTLGWTPNTNMRKRYNRVELDTQREALNTLEDAG